MREKVVIIGGGPAGLSAAIYLGRAGLSPLVFAGSPPGGQLMLTSQVENFPSYESILGPQLIEKMREQAEKFGAKIIDQNIIKVDLNGSEKKVYLDESSIKFLRQSELASGQNFGRIAVSSFNLENEAVAPQSLAQTSTSGKNFIVTKTLLIATGAKALWLNVAGEEELRGKGVSACATCDGFFFKDKVVAVVGGGDTAMEEALTLTKFAKKVYLIHRREQFRASKIMQERVFNNPKIEIIYNTVVEEMIGKEKLEKIKIRKIKILNSQQKNPNNFQTLDSEIKILPLDGLFVAIGHKPDTQIFKGQVEMDEKGYIVTSLRKAIEISKFLISLKNTKKADLLGQLDQWGMSNFNYQYQMATSVAGVFAAGDCVDFQYRQATTAAGMGVAAALEVERWLEEKSS